MALDPIILQAAISVPLAFALALYTLVRRDRSRLHLFSSALILTMGLWMLALLMRRVSASPVVGEVSLHLEHVTSTVMAPLFVVAMGHFARHPSFEHGRAATLGVSTIFALFFVAFATNDWHHLMISDPALALAGEHPTKWAGPLYWALQAWIIAADLLGLALCLWAWRRGRTPDERRRPLLVVGAIVLPVLAHGVYLGGWLPIDYTLAPGAFAIALLLFVRGIHRHGLFESQPIVRQDVIEHLPDGLVLANAEGLVLDANAAAEETLRHDRAELRGEPIGVVFAALGAADEGAQLAERIAALPLDGDSLAGEVRPSDGRCIEVIAGAVGAIGTQPAGRFILLQDRTMQRHNEQLLRERQKLESVGILAAGIAHEVNNPLAFVRSNLSHVRLLVERLLKTADPEPVDPQVMDAELAELREIADDSIEGIDRIGRIVESMLRFARVPEEGTSPVDMNRVVGEAIRLAALDRNSAVVVDRRLADDLAPVMGSEGQLVQVVLNLLLNANQALVGRSDARVTAETECDGSLVSTRVRDNGAGIPEEDRERIFSPFFTTRAPNQGTGLGLSIAFDIVREHGGALVVDSPPGGGTCFTIRLPMAAAVGLDPAGGEAGSAG